jgi:pyruvate dehydrogenase E1 component alpha subunit
MDVLAVHAAAEKAASYVRSGKGPYILEMMTYRYRGHSMSDPAKYRSREEVAKVRQEHDPIDHLRQRILDEGHADEAGLKDIDREIKDVISAATDFAQASPEPDAAELYTDVLAEA